jgi:hypothetical protein
VIEDPGAGKIGDLVEQRLDRPFIVALERFIKPSY